MTREEFAKGIATLSAAIGRTLGEDAWEIYFRLLGDLDYRVFLTSIERVLLERKWPTFPQIAELREAAALTMRGDVKELSPGEAWEIGWKAIGRIDPEVEGSERRALEKVPPLVAEALRCMGVTALCYGREPVGVLRGQFAKVFGDLTEREKRLALLPPSVRQSIGDTPKRIAAPAPIRQALESIGKPLE